MKLVDAEISDANCGRRHVRLHADAILVTHAHFDHLLDVPEIMGRTHAQLFAGPTAVQLVKTFGISPNECEIVRPGRTRTIGPWTIRVFAAQHDRLLGKIPFDRCPHGAPGEGEMPLKRPVKVSDWCVRRATGVCY